ncbi:unnamed protein product [Meganyctiphanes norvegica]|uniref:CC2D2A N-terminal C2 domain-containing protein n=1 Tax=Meganyctiphanes norvegica TaxID=48144 RepID=A0AAV2RPR3_MEGNR
MDVEAQAKGPATIFVPASTSQYDSGTGALSSQPVPGERRRPGRLRNKLRTSATTRFDEPLDGAESEAEEARPRWKQSTTKTTAKVSREESYDFFTQGIHKSSHKKSPSKSPSKSIKGKSEKEEEIVKEYKEKVEDEDSLLPLSQILGPQQQAITKVEAAYYIPYHQRKNEDIDHLFYPSILPADIDEKLGDNKEVRNIEEEGLHVGEKSYISKTNLNIIESRLLRQGNKQWFSEAGTVQREDNPISREFYHHYSNENEEAEVTTLTRFIEAQPAELLLDNINLGEDNSGLLELELNKVIFMHHSLFSAEHVLAVRLTQAYTSYKKRKANNVTQVLENRLKVLREALSKLRQIGHRSSRIQRKTVHEEIDSTRRLEIYRNEIRECRENCFLEAEQDRSLLLSILKDWKDLKTVRQKNGYHSTSLKIVIKKEETDKEIDEEKWHEDLQEEVKERIQEYEDNYTLLSKTYEKELSEWKEQHKQRKEAKRRKQQKTLTVGEEENVTILTAIKDDTLLATQESEKPKPPLAPDREKIDNEVKDIFSKARRPPGEPIISLELSQNNSITETEHCPDHERQRRTQISKTHVWVKISINKKLVTQTPSVTLTNDFSLHIGQTYRMGLAAWPRDIMIEVLEGSSLRQIVLADMFLPLPGKTAAWKEEYDQVDFSGKLVTLKTSSSAAIFFNETKHKKDFINGSLSYKVGWNMNENGQLMLPKVGVPPGIGTAPLSRVNLCSGVDPKVVKHWLENSHIDPNDPANASVVGMLQKVASGNSNSGKYFEIDRCEGDFCTEADLDANVRLRVLQLRDRGVPEFKRLRFVPAVESQVLRKELLKYENKTIMKDADVIESSEGKYWGPDQRYERVEKLLASLRRHMQQRYAEATQAPKLEDLVKEEQIPDIGTLGTSLLSIFKPSRPLRPERKNVIKSEVWLPVIKM